MKTTTVDTAGRPLVLSAEEAFAMLGIDRMTGYRAIKDGTFPVPTIQVGRLIKVPAAPLFDLLCLSGNEPDADGYRDAPAARVTVPMARSTQTPHDDTAITAGIGQGAR